MNVTIYNKPTGHKQLPSEQLSHYQWSNENVDRASATPVTPRTNGRRTRQCFLTYTNLSRVLLPRLSMSNLSLFWQLPPAVDTVGMAVSTLGVVLRFIDDTDDAGESFVLTTDVMLVQLPVAPRVSLALAIDDAEDSIRQRQKLKIQCFLNIWYDFFFKYPQIDSGESTN